MIWITYLDRSCSLQYDHSTYTPFQDHQQVPSTFDFILDEKCQLTSDAASQHPGRMMNTQVEFCVPALPHPTNYQVAAGKSNKLGAIYRIRMTIPGTMHRLKCTSLVCYETGQSNTNKRRRLLPDRRVGLVYAYCVTNDGEPWVGQDKEAKLSFTPKRYGPYYAVS